MFVYLIGISVFALIAYTLWEKFQKNKYEEVEQLTAEPVN